VSDTRPRSFIRLGAGARLWLLVSGMAALAFALYLGVLRGVSAPAGELTVPWWTLVIAFFAAEAYVVHLHFRSEAHTLSFSELALVLGLFLVAPGDLLLAQLLGAGIALLLRRRQRPLKAAFNLSLFALTSCLALSIFHTVIHFGDALGPVGLLGALAGAATSSVAGVALVSAAIYLAEGTSTLDQLPRLSGIAVAGSLASASLAVAAIQLAQIDLWAILLLIVPGTGCVAAFRAYMGQRRRHEHLEVLYQSMRSMQSAPEFNSAVRELLTTARSILRAELAELILCPPASPDRVLRSSIGPDGEVLMESVELGATERRALEVATSHDGAFLLPRGREQHPLDEYLAALGAEDGMLTALRGESRIFGTLLVGNRAGDVATFNADDCTLFETFAGHAALLLENDRLEQSLLEVTELKEQLRHQAFHDALTGLPNRTLFYEKLVEAMAAPGAHGLLSVLFIDLDDFKAINDTLGHKAGDELLVAVARRLRSCIATTDTAARFGGDEFAILLPRTMAHGAERVAQRLVETLHAPFDIQGSAISVSLSIGVASARSSFDTADELLRNADVAMYDAKAAGKRRFSVYEPQMHTKLRIRHERTADLERAVNHSEIDVHYQPIVTLDGGGTVALEALARWRHPKRGLVPPDEFIPLAEETGLMVPLGRGVLLEACTRMREWQTKFDNVDLGISVNLSPSELHNPDLANEVSAVLAATGLAPASLILEITETGAMRNLDVAVKTFERLRELGVRLALDDFGTGHSSLSHLRDFPLDFLKIAKPFVDRVEESGRQTAFADAILRLADALDLPVVAEGIEAPSQAQSLRALDCTLGQGYYFARPLDDAGIVAHLGTERPELAA
jgi:diguanylate cyclase (GGDEF)-like protein